MQKKISLTRGNSKTTTKYAWLIHSFTQHLLNIYKCQTVEKQQKSPSLIKLKYCEKGIETNYFNTNEKQGQISFLEPETHKIWKIFLKEKNTKLKMQI